MLFEIVYFWHGKVKMYFDSYYYYNGVYISMLETTSRFQNGEG